MRKHLLLPLSFFVCASLAFGGAQAQGQKGGAKGGERPPQPVIVTSAAQDDFVDSVEALGTLRANETVTLNATVTEKVTAVNFTDNQRVEKDDVLVEMTSSEEAAELDAEQAAVLEAKQQMERLEPLVKSGAASQSLLDERKRNYDTAKARLSAVQSRISDRLILAPFSGVVGLRNISVGATLQPGMTITTLDDDSVMKLDFSVPAIFLPTLKPGLDIVAMSAPFGDRQFKGQIASVDSQIDPVTRSITARALINNEDKMLKPGLLMSVELLKNPRRAIVVPEEAIVPLGRKFYVFIAVKGTGDTATAKRVEIEIGSRRQGAVEVLKGLKEGDLVITHGTLNISEGSPIRIRAQEQGDEPLQELLKQGASEGEKAQDGKKG